MDLDGTNWFIYRLAGVQFDSGSGVMCPEPEPAPRGSVQVAGEPEPAPRGSVQVAGEPEHKPNVQVQNVRFGFLVFL